MVHTIALSAFPLGNPNSNSPYSLLKRLFASSSSSSSGSTGFLDLLDSARFEELQYHSAVEIETKSHSSPQIEFAYTIYIYIYIPYHTVYCCMLPHATIAIAVVVSILSSERVILQCKKNSYGCALRGATPQVTNFHSVPFRSQFK